MVETIEQQIEQLRSDAAQLTPERLGRLDFDRLRASLENQARMLEQTAAQKEERQLLRQDLIGRIAGMVKAIAAVSRRTDHVREAVAYTERLDDRSAAELLEEYRLVSARFRDAFPTSFGRLFETPRRRRETFDRT